MQCEPSDLPCPRKGTNSNAYPIRNGKKHEFSLRENVRRLEASFGLNNLLFITITFRREVRDFRVVTNLLNGLSRHVFSRYGPTIKILEEHKNGALHVHIITVAAEDVRTGYDFERGLAQKRLLKGNGALTAQRATWGAVRKSYRGIGKVQVEPIGSPARLSDYLTKSISTFSARLKGARRVRYSQRFGWLEPKQFSWEVGLALEFRRFRQKLFGDHELAIARYGPGLNRLAWKLWREYQKATVPAPP